MLVYRIVHKKYSKNLFASGLKGRWNSCGSKVIYSAKSIPLAFLENMIRRQGVGFNDDFKIMIIEIPDSLEISEVKASELNEGWRDPNDYSVCVEVGDLWYSLGKTIALKVPSAVLVESNNYVINAEHAEFRRIKLLETTSLVPDERIEAILKKSGR